MYNNRLTGKKAEDVACSFLQKQGLILIERNYQCRFGEIDLIMEDNETTVFVEVRYRKSTKFGSAVDTVDKNKQRKLVFTANHFLQKHPITTASRFDVVALSPDTTPEWICNAFMEY